jgi:hypothetical protein
MKSIIQHRQRNGRKAAKVLGSVAICIGLIAGAASAQTEESAGPNASVVEPTNQLSIDTQASELATSKDITVSEAKLALGQSRTIIDAIATNSASPDFGSMWVTYKPYTLHLRMARKNPEIVSGILSRIGSAPVVVTVGGASSLELKGQEKEFVSRLATRNAGAKVQLDPELGAWVVTTLDNSAITDSAKLGALVIKADPVRATPVTGYGGLKIYVYTGSVYGWSAYCTGGFIMRNVSTGATGVLTAGHCLDYAANTRWYNGETPSVGINRTCGAGAGDGQVMPITGAAFSAVFTNNSTSEYVTNHENAGGYYIGQPVRQGRLNGGNVGTIESFNATYPIGAAGACPNPYTISYAFVVDRPSVSGDSGGPLVASYGGDWYAIGITTASITLGDKSVFSSLWALNTTGWNYCQDTVGC